MICSTISKIIPPIAPTLAANNAHSGALLAITAMPNRTSITPVAFAASRRFLPNTRTPLAMPQNKDKSNPGATEKSSVWDYLIQGYFRLACTK